MSDTAEFKATLTLSDDELASLTEVSTWQPEGAK
jgi:hypothetical protein